MPWRTWLAQAIERKLEAEGFQDVRLSIASINLKGISFDSISIGNPKPLVLENITVEYTAAELWRKKLQTLSLRGVHLEASAEKEKWSVAGLGSFLKAPAEGAKPFTLPVTHAELESIPFEGMKIENSSITLATETWRAELPIHITLQKQPLPTLSYTASSPQLTLSELSASADDITLDAKLNEEAKRWDGTWQIRGINLKDAPLPIPALKGSGTFTAYSDRMEVAGNFQSADGGYKADFSIEYAMNAPEKSYLMLSAATLPWNEGNLSIHNLKVPFGDKKDIKVNLEVKHISVDALMQMLTGKRAAATGTVSGILPITFKAGGGFLIHGGSLKADAPGTITVAPEAIPGDNAQLSLVRDMLKNLHYKLLSIGMESSSDKKLSVTFAVEGNNPDIYEGRPVKLKVHFGGDVLELLEQSVISFTNPKKLLEQGTP